MASFILISSFKDYLGDLHPLLVHLPIGIGSLAIVLKLLHVCTKNEKYTQSLQLLLFISLVFALISWASGWLHASDSKELDVLTQSHKTWATVFLVWSLLVWATHELYDHVYFQLVKWLGYAFVLFKVGDLGGEITHGYNLFTAGSPKAVSEEWKNLPNAKDAQVFNDLITPILSSKCYGCHSSKKQKGKLRLDTKDFILQGGEHGEILSKDTTKESKLIKNIHLPVDEDDHMPPAGKPQLTTDEIIVIEWWVKNGSPFDKKINEIPGYETILLVLNTSKGSFSSFKAPDIHVPAPNEKVIAGLKALGIGIQKISSESHLVEIHLNKKSLKQDELKNLLALAPNVISIHANGDSLNQEKIHFISLCENLYSLDLRNTRLESLDLSKFKSLKKLEKLNLSGARITMNQIPVFKNLPLKNLYVFQSTLNKDSLSDLMKWFPNSVVDTGNYSVPMWKSDTSEYTREEYNAENGIVPKK